MVFGGCKNYMGNHKSCDNNVIVHPGIAERATGGRRCQTDDNKVFQNQYHDNNHCVTHDGVFYSMSTTAPLVSIILAPFLTYLPALHHPTRVVC